jgi:beta-lactamase class A
LPRLRLKRVSDPGNVMGSDYPLRPLVARTFLLGSRSRPTGLRGTSDRMSIRERIEDVLSDAPGTFGLYARHLGTDEIVDINASQVLPTESAAKVFILLYYRQLVESGGCDPAQRIELTDDDRYWGTGVLRYLSAGIRPTLDDLAWLMVIVSDNAATAMLLQAIGDQGTVNAAMHDLGLESAQLNPAITVETAMAGETFATATPRDLAEAFTFLDDHSKEMLFR